MENYKKEIWEKDNININLNVLNPLLIQHTRDKLTRLCNVTIDSIDDSSFFISMSVALDKESVLLDINEKDGFNNLCSFLKIDTHKNDTIYIIWNYDNIDEIEMHTLQKYWDYIWYGTSDEMCLLYYIKLGLVVMITDYGVIKSN